MQRGDVYLADLEPARGSEANKARPVILVGNNGSIGAANRLGRGVLTVVPFSSNTEVRGAMHVLIRPSKLNGLRVLSKAQTELLRSIDIERLLEPLGRLGHGDFQAIEGAIRYHLAL